MIAEGFSCATLAFSIELFNHTPQSKGLERHHLGAYTFFRIVASCETQAGQHQDLPKQAPAFRRGVADNNLVYYRYLTY